MTTTTTPSRTSGPCRCRRRPRTARATAAHPGASRAFARNDAPEDGYDDDSDDDDDAPRREPRSLRWLVGGLLAAVLVIGLIFAVTNLGSLFKGGTPAGGQDDRPREHAGTRPEHAVAPAKAPRRLRFRRPLSV